MDLLGTAANRSGDQIIVLQVHVDLPGHGVVLRRAGLTVKVQRRHDRVLKHVDHRLGPSPLVRDVELVERRRVGAAIGLGLGRQLLHHSHLSKIDDADRVIPRV